MRLEYKNPFTPGPWKLLNAHTIQEASKELLALGPYAEDAVLRDADTQQVYKLTDPYGRNGGVRCDTNRGPCACGAFH